MDKNKTEQLTFGADEKEILKKMETVESSIGQNIQERNQRELIATKYYSEFVINTKNGPVTLNNVFITAEKDQQGNMSYHFRWIREGEKGEHTIEENMVVDKDGKVIVDYIYDDATQQNTYGYVAVKKDGKWGAIDQKGNVVQEPTYELEDYLKVDFIGRWHLGKDINMNYYNQL